MNTHTPANDFTVKSGLAQMLKGGVIMDVMNPDQSRVAEAAGAVAVMALERIPSQIRAAGGVARMSNPTMIEEIKAITTIPVMAKVRIGHFVEAQILESLDIDFIDESEVLTPADDAYHIDKHPFALPFVCGATNLGEALRRIHEGAAMIRTKGEAGTGNVVQAVHHWRHIEAEIKAAANMNARNRKAQAETYRVPVELVNTVADMGRLPVVTFAAGGIATPADAALMMQLGVDGVFVGSGIFESEDPQKMAEAIVKATHDYQNPVALAQASKDMGTPMAGLEIDTLSVRYEGR